MTEAYPANGRHLSSSADVRQIHPRPRGDLHADQLHALRRTVQAHGLPATPADIARYQSANSLTRDVLVCGYRQAAEADTPDLPAAEAAHGAQVDHSHRAHVDGCGLHHMDTRTTISVYGAPEFELARAAVAGMARYYNLPNYGYASHTDNGGFDK